MAAFKMKEPAHSNMGTCQMCGEPPCARCAVNRRVQAVFCNANLLRKCPLQNAWQRETRWRVSRLQSLPAVAFIGLEPLHAIQSYRRLTTRTVWPLHHQLGSVPAAPIPHDQPCADWMPPSSFRWTTRRRDIALPAPIDQWAFSAPWNPDDCALISQPQQRRRWLHACGSPT